MQDIQNTPKRFAIYTRISRDREGAGLGVERQLEDCEALVTQLGGHTVAIFSDNDISAYGGKKRPGYLSLLASMSNGSIDGVVAWHTDRLHRSMVELESYVTASEANNVSTHTVKAGIIDLSTPSGRLVARQLGAVARYEIEHAIERQKAAKLQAAKAGLPSGGNRGYGYEQNGMVIIAQEAAIVREVIDRFIARESWLTISRDLNDRGVPTAKGGKWTAVNVRNVAVRPRNIAVRVHNNDQYPAQWPALISMATWEDLQLAIKRGQLLNGKRSYTNKHLLAGFVYCGRCGCRMHIVNAQQRDGSYAPAFSCRKRDYRGDEVGCGRMKRRKAPLEDLITDCIMYRLDSPELGAMLEGRQSSTPQLKKLLRDQEAQAVRLRDVLEGYATGELTLDEYKTAKTHAQARLDALGREIDAKSSKATVANIPAGQTVREAWEKSDLLWRRQLIDALIEKILIHPTEPSDTRFRYKAWFFNPARIEICWKF